MNEKDAIDPMLDQRLRTEGEQLRAARAACPHPDLLLARTSDAVDASTREAIATHVAACPSCARLMSDLEAMESVEPDAALARVWSRVTASAAESRGSHKWLPVAAVVAVAAGAGALWMLGPSARHPSTTAPTTSTTTPRADVGPIALWAVEPPPVRVSAAALGQTRDGASTEGTAELLDALSGYREGRYAESIAPLEALARARPSDVNAAFYLGVARLLAGQPAEAVTALEHARAMAPPHRFAETDWYLATAAQRAGRLDVARTALDRVCSGESRFKAQACAARPQLR